MNKFVLIGISFLCSLMVHSQSVDEGRLQVKLGAGPFFGKIVSSHVFDSELTGFNGGSNSFTTVQNEFSFHYNTHKNFSIGLFASNVNNLKRDTSNSSSTHLGITVQAYLINKSKFNLFFDARVGGLKYYETTSESGNNIDIAGNGSLNAFSLGINKYFGNVFGVYVNSGFMRHAFRLTEYKIDNGDQIEYVDINKLEDIKTMFNGGFVNFGLTIKLRNKSPKSE